jgi:flagellar motor protein MotB
LNPTAQGSARRWRFAAGFCAVAAFTVIVGYYVPLRREAIRLRTEQQASSESAASARAALAQKDLELSALQAQNRELVTSLDTQKAALSSVRQRIEKLKETLTAQFSRLHQAKLLTVASAGDRVSIAVAAPVLFADQRPVITSNGRSLLCQLSKSIMDEFGGQIRVTGYYGKPSIKEPSLARRYATPWELSAVRAAAAMDVLEKGCAAPTDRFLVVGYGPRAAGPLGENVALEFVFAAGE